MSDALGWPPELLAWLISEGYIAVPIDNLALAPGWLRSARVRALFLGTRPLGAKDLLILRECRGVAPRTAVVVVATNAALTESDCKRAFESGATAFLSWPASPEVVRQALRSGEVVAVDAGASSTEQWKP